MRPGHSETTQIAAVVSDVDGTLVTPEKTLTSEAVDAVRRLHDAGIIFSVVSSRPPRGLRMLLEPLELKSAFAGFNGGLFVASGTPIKQLPLAPEVTRYAIDTLAACGAKVWVFTADEWLLRDRDNSYIAREKRTVGFDPVAVEDFPGQFDAAFKITGVSDDFDLLAKCEAKMREALAGRATVARSQNYYLDITHLNANKGAALLEFGGLFGVALEKIAVVGDGRNDVAMFEKAGLAVAMGNGAPEVRSAADFVTDSNVENGFAKAVERFILPRVASNGTR
jgi:Cof subfamily protein (haloacid dehalogenase superfamily)